VAIAPLVHLERRFHDLHHHLPAVQGSELRQVILLLDADSDNQGKPVADITGRSLSQPPPVPTERVLYPRVYQTAVPDHFKPVRFARADRYVNCVARHIGSMVVSRVNYTAKQYLHQVHLECDSYNNAQQKSMDTRDSATQTFVVPSGKASKDECDDIIYGLEH
jgi:hypothetical protein